jgi:acyl carrier protein
VEEQLTKIWSEVLQVARVGIHDNFFELGGHSLLAVRTASQIRQQLNVEVPLSVMFESPTVAELAPRILEKQVDHLESHDLAALLEEIESGSSGSINLDVGSRFQTNSGGE